MLMGKKGCGKGCKRWFGCLVMMTCVLSCAVESFVLVDRSGCEHVKRSLPLRWSVSGSRESASTDRDRIRERDTMRDAGWEEGFEKGAISMGLDELKEKMGGWGRARLVWDLYRIGVDPMLYSASASASASTECEDALSGLLAKEESEAIRRLLPTSRSTQPLGKAALEKLKGLYPAYANGRIEGGIADLTHISTSSDGTTKLLIRLNRDHLQVETVIIPWPQKGWSTLCISSQVGCRQGCTFCATGRMGKLRSLTSDEILAQFFFATKICRIANIHPLNNVVFMGMGEPADNAQAVKTALEILTHVDLYHIAQTKVTVSTVAPDLQSFHQFKDAPCVLAWSVHAANDQLRRQLVPTTKHKMTDLRQSLIHTLLNRPQRLRATMLEVALIHQLNDTPHAAQELVHFCKVIQEQVKGVKLIVNLIPFNDIGHPTYKKPTKQAVQTFQTILWESGLYAHIRTTRGDDESAACGQLATKKLMLQQTNNSQSQ